MKLKLGTLRKRVGLSQKQMAEAVNVKLRTYGSWERGEVSISASQLVACAKALDCSTDEILGLPIRTSFSDQREAELHRVWRGLSNEGKDHVLHHAKAEQALERGDEAEAHSPSSDKRNSA